MLRDNSFAKATNAGQIQHPTMMRQSRSLPDLSNYGSMWRTTGIPVPRLCHTQEKTSKPQRQTMLPKEQQQPFEYHIENSFCFKPIRHTPLPENDGLFQPPKRFACDQMNGLDTLSLAAAMATTTGKNSCRVPCVKRGQKREIWSNLNHAYAKKINRRGEIREIYLMPHNVIIKKRHRSCIKAGLDQKCSSCDATSRKACLKGFTYWELITQHEDPNIQEQITNTLNAIEYEKKKFKN